MCIPPGSCGIIRDVKSRWRSLGVRLTNERADLSPYHNPIGDSGARARRSLSPGQLRRWLSCSLYLVLAACSGNAWRETAIGHLTLSLPEVPSVLHPGSTINLTMRLAYSGASPVEICITGLTIGLRWDESHVSPVELGFTFDGGCLEHFTLEPGSHHDLTVQGGVFPGVPESEATLFSRIHVQLPLGQFYRPSRSYVLTAPDYRVLLQKAAPATRIE